MSDDKKRETSTDVRLVRTSTPHGVFVSYGLIEYDDKSGNVVDLQPVPFHFENEGEAHGFAQSIMRASRLPIIDVGCKFVVLH